MFDFLTKISKLFKPRKQYKYRVTCPVCEKTVIKKSNNVTCGKRACKLEWNRRKYALRKVNALPDAAFIGSNSPDDDSGSTPSICEDSGEVEQALGQGLPSVTSPESSPKPLKGQISLDDVLSK